MTIENHSQLAATRTTALIYTEYRYFKCRKTQKIKQTKHFLQLYSELSPHIYQNNSNGKWNLDFFN